MSTTHYYHFIRTYMAERLTTEEFISRAVIEHDSKYSYEEVVYISSHKKVVITCHKHGNFEQAPYSHLNGNGCKKCRADKLSKLFSGSTTAFVEKATLRHGAAYSYSKVKYINSWTHVTQTISHFDALVWVNRL